MPRDSHIRSSSADDPNWDNTKRDRFELLSAYLDGEVTAAERQQVLQWLETDQTMQCLYARLLKLRRGIQAMPVPPSEVSVEETLASVQARLYQRRPRRSKAVWGGAAIAATLALATVGSFALPSAINFIRLGGQPSGDSDTTTETLPPADEPAVESTPEPAATSTDKLRITLDQPVVPIPLAIEPVEAPRSADATLEQDAPETAETDSEDNKTDLDLL